MRTGAGPLTTASSTRNENIIGTSVVSYCTPRQIKNRMHIRQGSQFAKHIADRPPPTGPTHDALQSRLSPSQTCIGADSTSYRQRHAWHLGVKLPRMKIQNRWPPLSACLSQGPLHQNKWQQSKVTAACCGQIPRTKAIYQWRDLQQCRATAITHHKRTHRRRRHAIPWMPYRKYRGVVLEPQLNQYIDRPGCLPDDTKGRRSVSPHRLAGLIFKQFLSRRQPISHIGNT